MTRFLLRRLLTGMIALLGVLVVMFTLMHLAPVDPARQYAGPNATPQRLAEVSQQLGLDDPLAMQLVTYVKSFFTGQWGVSLLSKRPVLEDVGGTLPYTVELVALAMLLTLSIGIPLGVLSAHKKDRLPDHFSRILAVGLIAIPTFWLALGLQYVLAGKLNLLPLSGPGDYATMIIHPIRRLTGLPLIDALVTLNFAAFGNHLMHLWMPVIALTAMALGLLQRLTRASMVEILNEDYIVAVRSYGLSERTVLWRHGIKNSLGVLATMTALTMAYLLVNTFVIEAIFAWPGIGGYIVTAINGLDYPVILAITLLSAVSYLIFNTLADIVVASDPRVRLDR